MNLLTAILVLVAYLVVIEAIGWALKRGLFGRWFQQARVRLGRRIPAGRYRIAEEVGFTFGKEDTTLIIRLPVHQPGAERPIRYIGATDATTRFSINGAQATPDDLLAAYDDSLGPLEVLVNEPGRILELGISEKAR